MRRRGPLAVDLSERDRALLVAVADHGLLTAGQVERLLFTDRHASPVATRRRCQAVLRRLVQDEFLVRLDRRLGGHRAGSAGFTYRLSTKGRRAIGGDGRGGRLEPSDRQRLHLLACSEVSVGINEAERLGRTRSASVTHEPVTWRRFVGQHGGLEVLKPDLLVELTTLDGWELRWFIEVDRNTEHLPTVLRKCSQYQRYWQSGAEDHPVFPRVLWSVPDAQRRRSIESAVARTAGLSGDLFRVVTGEATTEALIRNEINNNEGGEL